MNPTQKQLEFIDALQDELGIILKDYPETKQEASDTIKALLEERSELYDELSGHEVDIY